MIAASIGQTFLKAYNERFEKNLSAKEFFDKVYFEYFFNHSKYMQWITNSPFVQMKSGQKAHLLQPEERIEKLENLHQKISEGERDASIGIGFPAAEEKEFATTSGLVTDIDLQIEEEEIYLSWIGGGLGIGVAGGYSVFFNEPEILIKLYEGWVIYRKYLNDPTLLNFRGNQINTWNGQWINFAYSKKFRKDFDFAQLHKQNVFSVNEKVIEVNTVNWSELFFNISKNFSGDIFTGYIYSLGQTNKTFGFYPFYFSQAKKLLHYYKILFGDNAALDDTSKYEMLFGKDKFTDALSLGSIGLQALEPKGLRQYYGKDSNLKLIKIRVNQKTGESEEDYEVRRNSVEQKDYETLITFRTYKTWLLAMITKNKEESLEYTAEVAEALHEYREGSTKTDRKNLIQSELLAAKNKKPFLDALTTLIRDVHESKLEMFKILRDKVHLMSAEDFGYFVLLLKFDYAYSERKRN